MNTIMKKGLLTATAFTMFVSCVQDNDLLDSSLSDESKEPFETEILSFPNEDEFYDAIENLSKVEEKERKEWVNKHYGKLVSLYDVYLDAMDEAATLDETQEAFEAYKEKYESSLFFPMYKDDCGCYLPVSEPLKALLLNSSGFVKIGGNMFDMRDISTYSQLQRLGLTLYDEEYAPSLKGPRKVMDHGDAIGNEYDSGWTKANGKKIRLKCGRQIDYFYSSGIDYFLFQRLHVEISFRKKTWAGYINYSSRVDMEGSFTFGQNVINVSESKTASSSHDYYYVIDPIKRVLLLDNTWGGTNLAVHADLTLHYRGIPDEYLPDYVFDLPSCTVLF